MKKNYYFKFILLMIPISAFALMSLSGGRDGAFSGSPGDLGNTCSNCHSGGSFGASVLLQTEIPATGYQLNTGYGIQVEMQGSTAAKHGFQITAERTSDNAKVGTFTADGTDNQLVNANGTHITHTSAGNTKKTWNFNWKAPTTDQGNIKFYVSAIAANGNTGTSGDQVVNQTSGNFSVLNLSKEAQLDFAMFPNPAEDFLNIQLPTGTSKAEVKLFDITGRLLKTSSMILATDKIDVQDLATGVYIVKITSDGKVGSQQFIKK